jgi:hypothetical protein
LVGLGTLKIHPDDFSPLQLAFCIVRDVLFTGWYTVLLYFSFVHPDSDCIQGTGIVTWLFFAAIVTLLRLVKNPLQFVANRKLQQNGANWENPEDMSQKWYRYFAPNYQICSMRIYSAVDWCSYFAWIVGLTSFRPSQQCNDNIVTQGGFIEIGISTIVYIVALMSYTFAFACHRSTKGRCLPGFTVERSPDGCPGVSFDRSQWRQPDESVEDYRRRVVQHFELMNYIQTQPIPMQQMTREDCRLTNEELETLRTLRYSSRLQRSPSVRSIRGRQASMKRPKKSEDTITVPTVLEEPSESVPQVPAPEAAQETREEDRTTDDTCALCIEDYADGELLRELHCGHRYHAECVDEWLTTSKRTCPVCNSDAVGRQEPEPTETPESQ